VSFEFVDLVPEERACGVCGQALLGDPDDQPFPPLGPMCGECYRAREFDQTLWEQESISDDWDG
jgi:hypothetical protein